MSQPNFPVKRETIEGLSTIVVGPMVESEPAKAAVVLCHGFGAPGEDLVPCSAELIVRSDGKLDNVVFIFPAAPIDMTEHGIPGGRAWWPINMAQLMDMVEAQDFSQLAAAIPDELPQESDRIGRLVDHVESEYSLDRSQVLVGGFSQGAMLACDVGLRTGGELGGLILWSGTFLAEPRWKEFAASANPMNIVQSHGMQDPVLPFVAAKVLKEFLVDHSHRVEFIEFDGFHQTHPDAITATIELISNSISSDDEPVS